MNDMSPERQPSGRLLKRRDVEAEVGLSRSSIYQRMDLGTFPRPERIGKRAVRWWQSDIEQFKRNPMQKWPSEEELSA